MSPETMSELRADFAAKKNVYGTLCGSLYPGIVYDELKVLQEQYIQAGGDWKDVTLPRHPGPGGYAR